MYKEMEKKFNELFIILFITFAMNNETKDTAREQHKNTSYMEQCKHINYRKQYTILVTGSKAKIPDTGNNTKYQLQ